MATQRSIVLGVAALLLGCGARDQRRSTFVLDVLGSETAFDSFVLSVDGLSADAKLHFQGASLIKTFSTDAPLDTVEGKTFTVRAMSAGGAEVSELAVTPFVCGSDPTFAEKLQAGWQGTETLQVYLQADGILNPENEFDRPLGHRCDWLAPGGGSGEGSATPNRSPTLCTESDRVGTALTALDVSDPAAEQPLGMTTCAAYLYRYSAPPDVAGVILDQFAIARPGDASSAVLSLAHCWRTAEIYPTTIAVTDAIASSCIKEGLVIDLGADPSVTEVRASAGSWTLMNGPDLPGGGHQVADVDLTFGTPGTGAPAFKVSGHIDLPVVKVDVVP